MPLSDIIWVVLLVSCLSKDRLVVVFKFQLFVYYYQ